MSNWREYLEGTRVSNPEAPSLTLDSVWQQIDQADPEVGKWMLENKDRTLPILRRAYADYLDVPSQLENGGKLDVGAPTVIYYPEPGREGGGSGLGRLPAFYALAPAESVIQSHDAVTFKESEGYPRILQERAYDRDQLEQEKVIRQATTFVPVFVINTNPDGVNGPPIIDADGFVLGGNSRVMAIKRVIAEVPGKYEKSLEWLLMVHDEAFGLEGFDVKGKILVRVLTGTYDRLAISRALNRAFTQSLNMAAQAVSLGRLLPPELFKSVGDLLASDDKMSLNQALNRRQGEILRMLQRAKVITPQNYSEYTKTFRGKVTDELSINGRQAIRLAIMGALIADKEVLALTTPRFENLYERLAPLVLRLEAIDPSNQYGYNFLPSLRLAIEAIAVQPATTIAQFEGHFRTGSLDFDPGEEASIQDRLPEFFADPLAAILAKWLIEASASPAVAARALRQYVNAVPNPESIFFEEELKAAPMPEELRTTALRGPWVEEKKVRGKDVPAHWSFPVANASLLEVQDAGIMDWVSGAWQERESRESRESSLFSTPSMFGDEARAANPGGSNVDNDELALSMERFATSAEELPLWKRELITKLATDVRTRGDRSRRVANNPQIDPPLSKKLNVATVPLSVARDYASREFDEAGLDLDLVLPDFDQNYEQLQGEVLESPDIPRVEMPVIMPNDMEEFESRLKEGELDLFHPFAKGSFVAAPRIGHQWDRMPEDAGAEWVKLGVKDGDPKDDIIMARITRIPATLLHPTQSQIWLEKLIEPIIEWGPAKEGAPILTMTTIIVSEEGFILDGHHRYAQVMLADPTLALKSLLVPLKIEFLLEVGRGYSAAIGHRGKNPTPFKDNTEVLSLSFSKDYFDRTRAVQWAKDNGFSTRRVDETTDTYRLRQVGPGAGDLGSNRTVVLTEGVKAVMGVPR